MKPIILVKNKYGKIEVTEERLQEIIDEAYEAGKKAGSTIINCPTTPCVKPDPLVTWRGTGTGDAPYRIPYIIISCEDGTQISTGTYGATGSDENPKGFFGSTGVKYSTESDAYLESLKDSYTYKASYVDSSTYPSNVTTTATGYTACQNGSDSMNCSTVYGKDPSVFTTT